MFYEKTRHHHVYDSSAQSAVGTQPCPLHDAHNFHKMWRGRTTPRRIIRPVLTNKLHSIAVGCGIGWEPVRQFPVRHCPVLQCLVLQIQLSRLGLPGGRFHSWLGRFF